MERIRLQAGPPPTPSDRDGPPPRPWPALSLPGVWGALVGVVLSLTPSLLPRSGITQGAVTGISAAMGYGLATLVAFWWREVADRQARRATARAWRIFALVAGVVTVLALGLGWWWQQQVRELMGAPSPPVMLTLLTPVVAAVVFLLLVAISRGVRRSYRSVVGLLDRWMGRRAARAVGWVLVSAATVLLLTGVLLDGMISAADRAFSVRDGTTPDDVEQPATALRSGGPGSVVPWDTLGRQGRAFVGRGPSVADLLAFHGEDDVEEPIRTYAGIATAEDVEGRAQRAVDDLERAGGFDRTHLLVATTTGTGWLDPGAMASFEYIASGDSAIVALQYSFLPSAVSYLVDQSRARAAGRELFDAVYERWVAMPSEDRPALYVFGESLGSFGAEAAFSGEFDLRTRTDGALFVGAPAFNVLYREFTVGRDAGSRQIEPVYRGGRTVRFATDIGAGAEPHETSWTGTRVLYLQHPSDPVVWWDARLAVSRPDWLREPRGRDVLDRMVWIPLVTFWQVTVDMPFAVEVPEGHGHRYTRESVDAWATILQPDGWTPVKADALRDLIRDD